MKIDRQTLPFKLFYFIFYAGLAWLFPYLSVYYESLGLSGQQIGLLAAIPSITTFVSAPLFGMITDLTQRHKLILGLSIFCVSLGVIGIWTVNEFSLLIPVVLFYAFFFAPILPLIDRSVLDALDSNKDQYGKQRLWGAVGWGLMAPIAGLFVERGGLGWAFYGFAFFLLILLGVSQITPIQKVKIQTKFLQGLGALLSNWSLVIFFIVMIIAGVGLAMIQTYLFIYLGQLGASNVVMGIALTISTISELLIMFYADKLLESLKASGLIILAMLLLALRLFAFSFASTPEIALVIQLLHGPTFGALWVAGVSYIGQIAPPGLGNTAQGIFTGVIMGLGSGLGAFLGGVLYKAIGFSMMYFGVGFVVFLASIVFILRVRFESKHIIMPTTDGAGGVSVTNYASRLKKK